MLANRWWGQVLAVVFLPLLPHLPSQSQTISPSQNYYCREGKTLTLTFLVDRLWLQLPQQEPQTLTLNPSSPQSSVLYKNQQFTLSLEEQGVFLKRADKLIYEQCTSSPFLSPQHLRYNCTAQIAPFLHKENLSLRQAENLRLLRDGAFFIYHCFPRSLSFLGNEGRRTG